MAGSVGAHVVADALASCDIGAIADAQAPTAFLDALDETVSAAMYWEERDDCDRWLAAPEMGAALRPVADAVGAAAAARWWATSTDLVAQHQVVFDDSNGEAALPLPPVDPRAALVAWRADTLDVESDAARLPTIPTGASSGRWWSTPSRGLICSTRALDGHGPVGLSLVEDSLGWTSAQSHALRPRPGASIFEIAGPEAWEELVERYPLTVTHSRRHDWWRATGQNGAWAIPDYLAVAADYDGIHLTVLGYLSTAGRALPACDAYTVLAGWNPDETWWLTDSAQLIDAPIRWSRDQRDHATRWVRAAT
jgi:hypothetical protein